MKKQKAHVQKLHSIERARTKAFSVRTPIMISEKRISMFDKFVSRIGKIFIFFLLISCEKIPDPGCVDIDGNIYKTVQIGSQVWMAENLRTTRLNDGTPIPENIHTWTAEKPYYCYLGNNSKSIEILYNWHTVSTNRLCPKGWDVPTDYDWIELERFVGMSLDQANDIGWRGNNEAVKLKSTYSWEWGNNGTDEYGFNATAVGYKYATTGNFEHIGNQVQYWTSTPDINEYAIRRSFSDSEKIYRGGTYRNNGFSVRCIKNEPN